MKKKVVIVAGGTGGHINGALAIGEQLESDSWEVLYLSGTRHLDYKLFSGTNVNHLKTFPLRYKNPLKIIKALIFNFYYFLKLLIGFIKSRPSFIIGCGGYVCGPSLLAGFLVGVPVYIVEQNAVMGLTNKILACFSKKIFIHFSETYGLKNSQKRKIVVSGNPTRQSIHYTPVEESGHFNILVFGGSLGASQINEIIKFVVSQEFKIPVNIVHQVGKGNQFNLQATENIQYKQLEYIDDMQAEYARSHLVICRAGASSISELRVIQRPVILIPYPAATDNHQFFNAQNLKSEASFFVEVLDYKASAEHSALRILEIINELANKENKGSNAPVDVKNSAKVIIDEIKSNLS